MAGLVADYGSESESDKSSNSDCEDQEKLPKPRIQLPKPDFNSCTQESAVENSVFVNPFIEAVNAKNAILEKHVKMISTDVKILNGKQICWNYRKNKCRFGHNCKFAHDSDIQNDAEVETVESKIKQIDASNVSIEDNEEVEERSKARKRPGLSQNLVPGKKVMKSYYKHKT